MFLSSKTVEFHLGSIYPELGVRSRAELVRRMAGPASPMPPTHWQDLAAGLFGLCDNRIHEVGLSEGR